jgi:tetratricopeptide (TPR) repeat protein
MTNKDRPAASDSLRARIAALADEPTSHDSIASVSSAELHECLALLERVWPDLTATAQHDSTQPAELTTGNACELYRGDRFGRFEVRRMLGRGGFGIVFLVFDPTLGREAALKVPRPELIFSTTLQDRFLSEARAAATLDHPGIVPIHEIGRSGPVSFILSGYCPGPTLANWLAARTCPIPVRKTVQIVVDLADAVHHAHTRGVLHRDLKPSNVLLDVETNPLAPSPRLTDFGLAKRLEHDHETQDGTLLGTPAYMSPELAAGRFKDIGVPSDVYSLGVILFEMLCGRPPFVRDGDAELLQDIRDREPPSPRSLRDDIPLDLQSICLKCLRKEPEARYGSVRELAADLRRFLAGESVLARPLGFPMRSVRWCLRRPLAAALVGLVCLTGTLGAAGVLSQWMRAEHNLSEARAQSQLAVRETTRARQNLEHAQQALLDLSWMIEESALWANGESHLHDHLNARLTSLYEQIQRQSAAPQEAVPILAAIHSYRARRAQSAGQHDDATDGFRRSIEMWQVAARAEPKNVGLRRALTAAVISFFDGLQSSGETKPAIELFEAADAALADIWLDAPADVEEARDRMRVANSLCEFAARLAEKKDRDKASLVYRSAANIARQAVDAYPDEPQLGFRHAQILRLLGAQRRPEGHPEDAEQANNEALAILNRLIEQNPDHATYLLEMAELRLQRGLRLRRRGPPAEAMIEYMEATRILGDLQNRSPDDAPLAMLLARSLRRLGGCQQSLGQDDVGLESLERACRIWHQLLQRNQLPITDIRQLAMTSHELGKRTAALQQDGRAKRAFGMGAEAFQALDGNRLDSEARLAFATCLTQHAHFARVAGENVDAIASYGAALDLWTDIGRSRHPGRRTVARQQGTLIRKNIAEVHALSMR